jgi:putative transposase
MRKAQFFENQYYHIFNRGTEKRKIFLDDVDYRRFVLSMRLMNDEQDGLMIRWRDHKKTYPNATIETFLRSDLRRRNPLVKIVCFSLLPNHYHFILEQLARNGIEKFMQRIGIGYTMYFNKKYKRSGVLFQVKCKSSLIKATHHLLYLSAYVNCNMEVHNISDAKKYPWSSFLNFLSKSKSDICNGEAIWSHFKNSKDYEDFAKENIEAAKSKKEDVKLNLE